MFIYIYIEPTVQRTVIYLAIKYFFYILLSFALTGFLFICFCFPCIDHFGKWPTKE